MKEAGRDLDQLIAEKVMGIDSRDLVEWDDFPRYSIDMSAAWTVVEKLYEKGFGYCLERAHRASRWTVHLIPEAPKQESFFVHFIEDMERISEEAESLPHAICNAALRAMGVEE